MGVVSDGVETLSAILAGTTFATDLLYLVMLEPCDRLESAWADLNLSLVVDDLAIQAVRPEDELMGVITAATRQAISDLSEIGCLVSVGQGWAPGGKTIAVSSSAKVLREAAGTFRSMGVVRGRRARHLGVDYTPGLRARHNRPVAKQRLKGTKARAKRVRALGLGFSAANRVLRSSVVPSAVHGAIVTGVTNKQLRELLSLSHGALGSTTGRSAYARLYLSGGVPGEIVAVAPIHKWACAAFDGLVPEGIMTSAWKRAAHDVGLAADPQGAVMGPAGATVAAAERLGWKMIGPFVFLEPTGNRLDLMVEAPHTVKLAALEAVDRWFADHSSLAEKVGGTPYLEPLLEVSNRKATGPAAKASLRVMAEGGWPTQASLHAAGLADSPLCRFCKRGPGTFYHRVRQCRGTQWMRTGPLGELAFPDGGPGSAWEEATNPLWRVGGTFAPEPVPPPRPSRNGWRWVRRRLGRMRLSSKGRRPRTAVWSITGLSVPEGLGGVQLPRRGMESSGSFSMAPARTGAPQHTERSCGVSWAFFAGPASPSLSSRIVKQW